MLRERPVLRGGLFRLLRRALAPTPRPDAGVHPRLHRRRRNPCVPDPGAVQVPPLLPPDDLPRPSSRVSGGDRRLRRLSVPPAPSDRASHLSSREEGPCGHHRRGGRRLARPSSRPGVGALRTILLAVEGGSGEGAGDLHALAFVLPREARAARLLRGRLRSLLLRPKVRPDRLPTFHNV